MMLRLLLFFLFISNITFAQIVVKDQDNNAISDVHIFRVNKPKEILITNESGQITIPKCWEKKSMLVFSHTLYKRKEIQLNKLNKNKEVILKEDDIFLEEIIVSVNVNDEAKTQRAEKRILISQREIERLQTTNSADLLGDRAGVSVQKSQSGGGSPNIRGYEANRILLMIDGVRMNNAIFRGGHLQNSITIDPAILANSEILFGPSSVVYGSDAMGGVVHFKTKNPTLLLKPKFHFYNSFISGSRSSISHFDAEYSFKRLALLSSFTRSDFGELRMGKWRLHGDKEWGLVNTYMENGFEKTNENPHIQKRTDYRQFDFLQKAVYHINDEMRWINNFQYSTSSDINRFDQLNDIKNGELKFADWYYGPQKRLFFSSSFQDFTSRKLSDFSEVIFAYQNMEESRHKWKNGADFKTNGTEDVHVYSINANFNKGNYGYGLELISNEINSTSNKEFLDTDTIISNNYTRYPSDNSGMKQGALYFKKEHSFNEKLKANAGVRATYTETKGRYILEKDQIQLPEDSFLHVSKDINWNLSLVYHPKTDTKISGIVSTGFHAPNVDDMTKFFVKGDNQVIPNLELKTEYSRNFEINISKHLHKKHLLNFDVYYSHLINPIVKVDGYLITYNPGDIGGIGLQSNINEGKGYIWGSTIYWASKWSKKWKTSLDITYTKGKITERAEGYDNVGGEILGHIPPVFGKFKIDNFISNKFSHNLSLVFASKKSKGEYDVAGVDNLDETPVNESGDFQGNPAWFTLNYQSQFKVSKKITLHAGLSNMLNLHYKTYGSGISAMGRSLNLTVRAKL